MSEESQSHPDEPMTPGQEAELRALAERAGEEVPTGMRRTEAAQRIVELRSALGE